jgi:hypothetical protein
MRVTKTPVMALRKQKKKTPRNMTAPAHGFDLSYNMGKHSQVQPLVS